MTKQVKSRFATKLVFLSPNKALNDTDLLLVTKPYYFALPPPLLPILTN